MTDTPKTNFIHETATSSVAPSGQPEIVEANRLIQENLRQTQEVLVAIKKIQAHIKWQQLWGLLRFLIIIVPIVLGFIYLPPLLKDVMSSYPFLFKK